jgi:hypothetical protein
MDRVRTTTRDRRARATHQFSLDCRTCSPKRDLFPKSLLHRFGKLHYLQEI